MASEANFINFLLLKSLTTKEKRLEQNLVENPKKTIELDLKVILLCKLMKKYVKNLSVDERNLRFDK